MKIILNSKNGFYEIWNEGKLIISSDSLDGIVLSKKELDTLLGGGEILIEDEKRIDSIITWSMFL